MYGNNTSTTATSETAIAKVAILNELGCMKGRTGQPAFPHIRLDTCGYLSRSFTSGVSLSSAAQYARVAFAAGTGLGLASPPIQCVPNRLKT